MKNIASSNNGGILRYSTDSDGRPVFSMPMVRDSNDEMVYPTETFSTVYG